MSNDEEYLIRCSSSGYLDIVKKGYARGAEQLYQFCSGRPQASCREGLAQARHEALVLFGSELA
jgi:hypothetical protein